MIFLWDLHSRSGSYNVSMSDLYDVVYRACGNKRCDGTGSGSTLTWTLIRNAAMAKWGVGSAQFISFDNWAGVEWGQ
jgi:hypothetical protein